MKNLIIFIVLSVVFSVQAFAQDNLPCPTISVISSGDLLRSFENVEFKAKVESANLDKIGYLWTVSINPISEGQESSVKIIEGQGTSIIKATDKQDWNWSVSMTAAVEITGLPGNCPKTASASANVIRDPAYSMKVDEFSIKPPGISKNPVDIFSLQLSNDPTAKAYIFEYFKGKTSRLLIERKLNNLLEYLKFNGIPAERIKLFIAIDNKNLTQLWIVPQSASKPPIEDYIEINAKTYQQDLAKIFASKQKIVARKDKKIKRNL